MFLIIDDRIVMGNGYRIKHFRCVRKIAKSDFSLRRARQSVRLSAWNNSAPIKRIFMTFDIIFRKSVDKIQVSLKSDKNNGYFTWRRFHIHDNISMNYV